MRIRVYEVGENPAVDHAIRHVSKSTAQKLLSSGGYRPIDRRTIQAIDRTKIAKFIKPAELYIPTFAIVFYPEQFDHPELRRYPSHRYPMQLAPNHKNRRRRVHAG